MKGINRITSFLTVLAMSLVMLTGCAGGGVNANDSELSGLTAGQHIYFGSYPQTGSQPEPIEWCVLDVKDGRALVISEKILDCQPYNKKEQSNTTYAGCSLRKWLNGGFMDKAFSQDEKNSIAAVTNPNPAPPEEGNTGALFAQGGEDTVDSVFCLSYDEVMAYFPGEDDKLAETTSYAEGKGAFALEGRGEWWLRTQGYDNSWAMTVNPIGMIDTDGSGVWNDGMGVRPAMWVTVG